MTLSLLAAVLVLAQVEPPRVVDPGRLPKPVIVDKVVAFVASRPITLSEVELELRLERAAAGDVAGATGTVTPEALADLLPTLVERTIVLRGMQSQYVDTLEPGVVETQVARMRDAFGSEDAWAAFLAKLEMSDDEVRERRRRVLEAGTILDAAVHDALNVKREDLETFLAEHPEMTREQAERELLALTEARVRDDLIARKKKDLQAVTVDSIVPRTGAP